ncbi:MAG: DNA mismatch repair protein MutS, partial [Robiginitalea sp.]
MKKVPKKTLEDLEFPRVIALLAERCVTGPGRENAEKTHPFLRVGSLRESLGRTQEYLASFQSENRIPNHGFESVDSDLHLLRL